MAKQENLVSNSLGNKVGIFRDLAFLPSMRAYLRARILLRIGASGAGPRLPARSRKLPRLFPAPSLRPAASFLVAFFSWPRPSTSVAKAAASPADPDALLAKAAKSGSFFLLDFVFSLAAVSPMGSKPTESKTPSPECRLARGRRCGRRPWVARPGTHARRRRPRRAPLPGQSRSAWPPSFGSRLPLIW